MIPEDKLNAWEAAARAATEGPWSFDGYQMISQDSSLNYGTRIVLDVEQGTVYSEYSSDSASLDIKPEDATFIALSREAVPALIEEVRRLRALGSSPDGDTHRAAETAVLATDLALVNDLIYTHGGDAALAGWVRICGALPRLRTVGAEA